MAPGKTTGAMWTDRTVAFSAPPIRIRYPCGSCSIPVPDRIINSNRFPTDKAFYGSWHIHLSSPFLFRFVPTLSTTAQPEDWLKDDSVPPGRLTNLVSVCPCDVYFV